MKDAIESVLRGQQTKRFYYFYFTVPKKDGGLHPILDLRGLNHFIVCKHFQMVTLQNILPLISKGNWMAKLTL